MNKSTLIAVLALFTVSSVTVAQATTGLNQGTPDTQKEKTGVALLMQDIQKDKGNLQSDIAKRNQDRRLLAEKKHAGDKAGIKQARAELVKDRAAIKADRKNLRKDKKALQQKHGALKRHVKEHKVG